MRKLCLVFSHPLNAIYMKAVDLQEMLSPDILHLGAPSTFVTFASFDRINQLGFVGLGIFLPLQHRELKFCDLISKEGTDPQLRTSFISDGKVS